MNILITGFEPFGGQKINPSEKVVNNLDESSIPGIRLDRVILPVDMDQTVNSLLNEVESKRPDAVICIGEAGRRSVISIERVAINLMDYRITDNRGNQAIDKSIIPNGPAAYFSTLPTRKIYNAMIEYGVPAELSYSAGTFLCNQVFFGLLHFLHQNSLVIPAGFIHLPFLPEQVTELQQNVASMNLDTMIKGILAAASVLVTESSTR